MTTPYRDGKKVDDVIPPDRRRQRALMMIGGGAVLAAVAGPLLSETAGHYVLLTLMAISSALSILAILLVFRREARLR